VAQLIQREHDISKWSEQDRQDFFTRRGKRYKAQQGVVNVLSGAPYGYQYMRKADTSAASWPTPPIVPIEFFLFLSKSRACSMSVQWR